MMDIISFYTRYALLLLFGILLSATFAGVRLRKKNNLIIAALFVFCGIIQVAAYASFDEATVWKIYPLITHLPTALLLCLYYRKRLSTSLAAVTAAYLCCQPPKWFGLLLEELTGSYAAGQITHIIMLLLVGTVTIWLLASYISEIYSKDNRSVFIFGIVPMVYYVFDYSMSIYTGFWTSNNRTVAEFLPFFLCIAYMVFCIVYYQEYEKKTDAERKEQIIRITVEQQAKESEAVKRSEQEIRILRHDMRMFLNSLSLCLEEEGPAAARNMISAFASNVEATAIKRYCENATVNYILSDCAAKCRDGKIDFQATVELEALKVDEIMFSSILSNALENARNAQKELPEAERSIKLMLKTAGNKLLVSVRNPFGKKPVFVDGMPVPDREGDGYGTQSIRYMTERLGGKCQFRVDNKMFVLRVVL